MFSVSEVNLTVGLNGVNCSIQFCRLWFLLNTARSKKELNFDCQDTFKIMLETIEDHLNNYLYQKKANSKSYVINENHSFQFLQVLPKSLTLHFIPELLRPSNT